MLFRSLRERQDVPGWSPVPTRVEVGIDELETELGLVSERTMNPTKLVRELSWSFWDVLTPRLHNDRVQRQTNRRKYEEALL